MEEVRYHPKDIRMDNSRQMEAWTAKMQLESDIAEAMKQRELNEEDCLDRMAWKLGVGKYQLYKFR